MKIDSRELIKNALDCSEIELNYLQDLFERFEIDPVYIDEWTDLNTVINQLFEISVHGLKIDDSKNINIYCNNLSSHLSIDDQNIFDIEDLRAFSKITEELDLIAC